MNAPAREINWKKNLFFLWLSQILSMAGFAAVMPFIPIYLRDHLHIEDEQMRGLWVSAFNFFGLFSFCLSSPLWGVLADRYGRKLMLLRANYVSGILFPCLILAPNVIVLIIIRFFISAFSGTVTAAQTLVVTNTPEAHHGFALGTLSTALWSGNMAGFLAGGLIVNYFGFAWAFMICGILYLTGGVLVQFFVDENFVRAEVPRKGAKKQGMLSGFSAGIWIILLLFVMMGVARRFDEPYIAMMVEKIQTTIVNTIPLWKSQMVIALGLEHSRQAVEAQRAVTNMTNELLKKNAELLHSSTVAVAEESERGIVDIETLTETNEKLIATMDDVLRIQREGHEKRVAAEAQMAKIESELRKKLVDVTGLGGSAAK